MVTTASRLFPNNQNNQKPIPIPLFPIPYHFSKESKSGKYHSNTGKVSTLPDGVKAHSRREVWRIAERGAAGAASVAGMLADARDADADSDAFDADPELGEEQALELGASSGAAGVTSPVVAAVVGRTRPAATVGSAAHRFPDSMVDYLHYHERPSSRAPPRDRSRA